MALFSANDSWGFELLQAAREAGLHVPEDVAILGVDDEALLCEIAHPPLSSIRIGAEQIGRISVALLDQLLRGSARRRKSRGLRYWVEHQVNNVRNIDIEVRNFSRR